MAAKSSAGKTEGISFSRRLLTYGIWLAAMYVVPHILVARVPTTSNQWFLAIGIALAAGLALAVLRATSGSDRWSQGSAIAGMAFGFASALLCASTFLLLEYCLFLFLPEARMSILGNVYQLTQWPVLRSLFMVAAPATLTGFVAIGFSWLCRKAHDRARFAASAVRSSIVGLICGGAINVAAGLGAVYRWANWG
jgi:hypothetical protein